jgi:hypothetical protein
MHHGAVSIRNRQVVAIITKAAFNPFGRVLSVWMLGGLTFFLSFRIRHSDRPHGQLDQAQRVDRAAAASRSTTWKTTGAGSDGTHWKREIANIAMRDFEARAFGRVRRKRLAGSLPWRSSGPEIILLPAGSAATIALRHRSAYAEIANQGS